MKTMGSTKKKEKVKSKKEKVREEDNSEALITFECHICIKVTHINVGIFSCHFPEKVPSARLQALQDVYQSGYLNWHEYCM